MSLYSDQRCPIIRVIATGLIRVWVSVKTHLVLFQNSVLSSPLRGSPRFPYSTQTTSAFSPFYLPLLLGYIANFTFFLCTLFFYDFYPSFHFSFSWQYHIFQESGKSPTMTTDFQMTVLTTVFNRFPITLFLVFSTHPTHVA